jgi:tRNA(adenine34) deaminase
MEDERFMSQALALARLSLAEGEVPIGAVIVKDGIVCGEGHNQREAKRDVSSHAEIEAIRQAGQTLGGWRLNGCTLYVTLEPCLMCAGAILQARISRLVFGAADPKDGAIISGYGVFDAPGLHERPLLSFGVKEKECEEILKNFFREKRR